MECMKMRFRKRSALLAVGTLFVLVAVPAVVTWSAWRQAKLNRELLIAISKNDIQATEHLLSKGADANAHFAPAEPNFWQMLVNMLQRRSSSEATGAPTPLMYVFAVATNPKQDASGRYLFPLEPVAMVQLLLHYGAKPDGKYSDGSALLLMPVSHKWTECVRLMLAAGADPNATDKYGLPVMRIALLLRDTNTVQAFINSHANVTWKDAAGNTPLRIAKQLHDSKMLLLLKQAGANQ
jgi:ankyrin repeat protein